MSATQNPDLDPRAQEARRRLEAASAQLAEEERERRAESMGDGNVFALNWLLANLGHWFALCVGFTLVIAAVAWTYYLLNTVFAAGRAIAVAVGMFSAVVGAYASQYFVSTVEATFDGIVKPQGFDTFDWKEWFWTLPYTVGILVWSVLIGYFLSRLTPRHQIVIIAGVVFLTHPYFQLSALATQSPLLPWSRDVATTYVRRPHIWFLFYAAWALLLGLAGAVVWQTLRVQPIAVLAYIGVVVATYVVGYAVSLGHLARYFRTILEAEEEFDE